MLCLLGGSASDIQPSSAVCPSHRRDFIRDSIACFIICFIRWLFVVYNIPVECLHKSESLFCRCEFVSPASGRIRDRVNYKTARGGTIIGFRNYLFLLCEAAEMGKSGDETPSESEHLFNSQFVFSFLQNIDEIIEHPWMMTGREANERLLAIG